MVQTAEPVSDESVWDRLDSQFFIRRPDVTLRLFGFYGMPCDLGFAARMKHLRKFAADCLMNATRVEAIAEMPSLETLSLGVFSLDSFEGILGSMSPDLRELSLGQTRSKKPDLRALERFRDLRVLFIEGHRKNVEVLSTLRALEDLTLRSVTVADLGFLAHLDQLWSLDLKLGGCNDLRGIASHPALKYLELWQIHGLTNVEVIGELPALQNVHLESLRRVTRLPDLRRAHALRRIHLQNLKGLKDLTPLESAPSLEEVGVTDGSHLQPEDLVPVLRNKSLRHFFAGLGSDKKNARVDQLRREHGIAESGLLSPFVYR